MQNVFSRGSICILIAVSCFCLAIATSCGNETETITVTPINFSALKEKISSNKGRVLIVDFWATWCPPCRKEVPGFINLYKKYKDKGLEIIAVSIDRGGISVVQQFVQKYGINYPIFLGDNEIGNAYKIEGIPTTLIIGKDGETKSRHVGYVSEEEFEKELLALLK